MTRDPKILKILADENFSPRRSTERVGKTAASRKRCLKSASVFQQKSAVGNKQKSTFRTS